MKSGKRTATDPQHCTDCDGTGTVGVKTCSACNGEGEVRQDEDPISNLVQHQRSQEVALVQAKADAFDEIHALWQHEPWRMLDFCVGTENAIERYKSVASTHTGGLDGA